MMNYIERKDIFKMNNWGKMINYLNMWKLMWVIASLETVKKKLAWPNAIIRRIYFKKRKVKRLNPL